MWEKLLNEFALKFVNEKETPIYEELIEKYIELFYQPKKFIDKFGGGNCGWSI